LLKKNISKYKVNDISPIHLALSNQVGKADFWVSSGAPEELKNNTEWDYGNKSSSLLPPNKTQDVFKWLKFENKEIVNTSTLELFCKENKIDTIDFIHIDVQGAELMVLSGARSKIPFIKMIWMEVENIELYKNQPLKDEVEKFMKTSGFTKIKDNVSHIAGDQLWVNLNYFPRKKLTNFIWKCYSKLFNGK
jgi:FkbM family methyltransferase